MEIMTAIALEADNWLNHEYALIEWFPIPSMAPEYETGPCEGFNIYLVDTKEETVKKLGYDEAVGLYNKRIRGRRNRIDFWTALKHMKYNPEGYGEL